MTSLHSNAAFKSRKRQQLCRITMIQHPILKEFLVSYHDIVTILTYSLLTSRQGLRSSDAQTLSLSVKHIKARLPCSFQKDAAESNNVTLHLNAAPHTASTAYARNGVVNLN